MTATTPDPLAVQGPPARPDYDALIERTLGQVDPRHRKLAREMMRFWEMTPLNKHLGVRFLETREDYARIALPFRPELVRTLGVVHGGAIATLMDDAAAVAIHATYMLNPRPGPQNSATIDMTVSYLDPAVKEDIIAEARVVRRGRSIAVCQVDVRTPSGVHVATGLVTYKLGPVPQRPGGNGPGT